ncbi:hypothetical protein D7X32_32910 [Corallococcus carmarthensis]|uniref:VWA domain-containing protein n=1 Tax=Corallococcus carmarthensis TaxID=2316728 RepID=A0A3A8JQV8_9BACT|nr:hypothetical protein D7X32_32910 [Corallococcus carmarthensis]
MRLHGRTLLPPPVWLQEVLPLEADTEHTPLEVPPLIEPRRRRALLSTALATDAPEGRPLMEPLVRAIARAQVLTTLPRRSRPTLRRGVQLLVDVGEGMIPFDSDVRSMVEGVRRCAGESKTTVLSFTGSPQWGVTSADGERRPWSPPLRGTPLLLLTDLGLGGPPTAHRAYEAEWLRFAAAARHAGCPLIAWVPYPPQRWPRALQRKLVLLHWDGATRASAIRHRRTAQRPERIP